MLRLTIAAALLFAAPAAAADTPVVQRMRAAAQADIARNEALLERLVKQNSGTLNAPGVRIDQHRDPLRSGFVLMKPRPGLGLDGQGIERDALERQQLRHAQGRGHRSASGASME